MTVLSFYCFSKDEKYHENIDISARSYTSRGNWVRKKSGNAIKDAANNIMLSFADGTITGGIRRAALHYPGKDWGSIPTQTTGKFDVFDPSSGVPSVGEWRLIGIEH